MCKKRFLLTYGTPLMNDSTLAQGLGQLGGSTAAVNIIEGTYEVPAETDRITTELLKLLHDLAYKYSKLSMSTKIRIQECKKFWLTCRRKNSSSYSGLHFGHYKASAHNKFLASIHAKRIEICLQKGIPLRCWLVGFTVMLEKIPGINLVEKLRAILLMEVDLNFGNRLLFGSHMVKDMEK